MSHKTHHYSDGKVVSQNVKENADTIASSLVNDSFYGTVVSNDFNQTKQAVALAIVLCSMFLILLGFLFFKFNLIAFAFFCIGVLALVGWNGVKGIFMAGILGGAMAHILGLWTVKIFA